MTLQLKVFIGILLTIALVLFIISNGYAWVLVAGVLIVIALALSAALLAMLWQVSENIANDIKMFQYSRERKKKP